MTTKKINIKKFSSKAISKEDAQNVKGGYKQSFGGSGSTGFISLDDIEIREEGYKILYGFTPTPTKKLGRTFGV